jgi:hypothetical protein
MQLLLEHSQKAKVFSLWEMEIQEIIAAYLGNTPFASFFQASVPFDAI